MDNTLQIEEKDMLEQPIDLKNQNVTPVEDFRHGKITREYSYWQKELLSHGGHYRIKFPRGADEIEKTLIIAATMMLDMNFYDRKCCLPIFPC